MFVFTSLRLFCLFDARRRKRLHREQKIAYLVTFRRPVRQKIKHILEYIPPDKFVMTGVYVIPTEPEGDEASTAYRK